MVLINFWLANFLGQKYRGNYSLLQRGAGVFDLDELPESELFHFGAG